MLRHRRMPLAGLLGLLLLAGALLGGAAASQPESSPPGPSASGQEASVLHLDSPILRLDAERTVPALRATLVLDEDGLRMDFAVDRATLIGMKESSFGASIDPVQVMTWPADRPVWVTARPGPELAQRVQQALASGQGLEQLAAEKSSAGFPLLLDLEGYRLVRVLRETGSSTVPGEVER